MSSGNNFYCMILAFCNFLILVHAKPVNNTNDANAEQADLSRSDMGESRAGISDLLNPINLLNGSNNKEGTPSASTILTNNPITNMLNGSQALQSQNDLLKEVKLFFVTVQGAVMPASTLTGGLTNFVQGLGNMGNMFGNLGQNLGPLGQAAQNLNPLGQAAQSLNPLGQIGQG